MQAGYERCLRDECAKQNGDYNDPDVMVIGMRTWSQSARGAQEIKGARGGKGGIGRKCGTHTFGDIIIRNCM